MKISKSKYCKFVQCEKLFWLNSYEPIKLDDSSKARMEMGKKVGELAKGLFGDYEDVPYNKNHDIMVEKTEVLLQEKPNVITEASFTYMNNVCRVDILKNDADGVEIYEVKGKTKFEDIDLNDPSFQYFVLSNLGYNVKKVCVVYLNRDYIRGKELDIEQLFNIEDVTDVAKERQDEIRANLDFMNRFIEEHGSDNEPDKDIGIYCLDLECGFWQHCSRHLPKPNVFDLKGRMRKTTKIKKYNENKISFEDLEHEKLNEKCMEQIDFELHDREPKIEKEKIREILGSLKYPLYFIDYESFQCAIPEYEGTFANQQIPFQYSLHIIRQEGGAIEHKGFLAEVDDENIIRNFAESMIGNLSEDGSVIVYNKTFEKSHINDKIANMYPDLRPEIERINGNMVDFEVPFKNRNYYVKDMKGFSSIKKVLPALYPDDPKLNHSNLELVHNGGEASNAFLSLRNQTPEEQEKTREALLEYCKLDTYAMVKIWEKFKEVAE